MFGSKRKAIIFIDKNRLVFYGSNISQPLTMIFKPEIVRDLEIINKEVFSADINTFLTDNKIQPTNALVVVSSAMSFQKDFPLTTSLDDLKKQTQEFLDYVPFQNPLQKNLKNPKSTTLISTNGDLYEDIKSIFESYNFIIEAIAPITIFNQKTTDDFSPHTAHQLLSKYDWVKQNSFTSEQPKQKEVEPVSPETEKKNSEKKKTIILVSVFVVLLGILGGLLYFQNSTPPKSLKKTSDNNNIPVMASPSAFLDPTTVITTPSTSTILKETEVRMQILSRTDAPKEAEKLKNQFNTIGFTNIQTGSAANVTISKTLILFSPRVSPLLKGKIITEVRKNYSEFSSQESNLTAYDVVITTSKSSSITPTNNP